MKLLEDAWYELLEALLTDWADSENDAVTPPTAPQMPPPPRQGVPTVTWTS